MEFATQVKVYSTAGHVCNVRGDKAKSLVELYFAEPRDKKCKKVSAITLTYGEDQRADADEESSFGGQRLCLSGTKYTFRQAVTSQAPCPVCSGEDRACITCNNTRKVNVVIGHLIQLKHLGSDPAPFLSPLLECMA